MHFDGCNTKEAIEVVKAEKKEKELKNIIIAWEKQKILN